ncbi:acyl-CoA dehydrogenase family protein [Blastococcus sp. HT6-30]|uniref:acyl-CoA dehydrogenase family protein n=1 Tax=Blastococcus sp. HT6-30 TaxID=3144843 RepID=UPI00321C0D56
MPETDLQDLRAGVRDLASSFPAEYWRRCDAAREYPEEFVRALTEAGWLSVLIPEEYGGGGLGLVEASVIMEEINSTGASTSACHAQMYTMGAVLRHGSEAQKRTYLPDIAAGKLRLQAFAITEPDAGSDTTRITTFARRTPEGYVVNGRKMWISRVQHSDLMLLLARTTPREEVAKRTDGLSLFLVDLREAGSSVRAEPIDTMVNHETNAVFIDDLELSADALVGEEGQGFRHVLSGMNAERILLASESIGDARWFLDTASAYARDRVVFGKPIGDNQGVSFPLARAWADMRAASLVRDRAAELFDGGETGGTDANVAKLLASEAAWAAGNAAMTTLGGYGMAAEYDVERKFRESRLYLVAPVSNNLILQHVAGHVLGLGRG